MLPNRCRPLFGLGQWMRALCEMNELQQAQEQIMQDSRPKVTMY
jgi:hypothetical protein